MTTTAAARSQQRTAGIGATSAAAHRPLLPARKPAVAVPAYRRRSRCTPAAASSEVSAATAEAAASASVATAVAGCSTSASHDTTHVAHVSINDMGSMAGMAPPLASLSRMLMTMQPTQLFRSLAERSALPGPAKLVLVLVALLAAVAAVTRAVLMRKVKACRCCKGYGIMRCQVCEGKGSVLWQAKLGHTTSCPLCFNRRYVACTDCGGSFPRPIFAHTPPGSGAVPAFEQPPNAAYSWLSSTN